MHFAMMESDTDDCASQLFISQSKITTQRASEAVNFLENDKFWDDIDDHSFPEDVVYWDFSDQVDNSSIAPSLPLKQSHESNQNLDAQFCDIEEIISEDYFADGEEVSIGLAYKILVNLVMRKHHNKLMFRGVAKKFGFGKIEAQPRFLTV